MFYIIKKDKTDAVCKYIVLFLEITTLAKLLTSISLVLMLFPLGFVTRYPSDKKYPTLERIRLSVQKIFIKNQQCFPV
jgi:hypothetical protein